MKDLIQLDSFAIQTTLKTLLIDRTTKKNIIWATNSYQTRGNEYENRDEITIKALKGLNAIDIQPRVLKTQEIQKNRTKNHAEVFTPSWLCNKMNNFCDEQWFGKADVFNIQGNGNTWRAKSGKIRFPKEAGKTWQKYVRSRRIEITCGEAPFLVSRYDTTTGELINVSKRIGMLDRKLRVVNENTTNEEDWFEWVMKAYQSVYGYEFQGDNLLIARINLILTFVDYMEYKWKKPPTVDQLKKIATIVSWNIWQMDGLTYGVPFGGPIVNNTIPLAFDTDDNQENLQENEEEKIYAKIKIWRKGRSSVIMRFKDFGKEKEK